MLCSQDIANWKPPLSLYVDSLYIQGAYPLIALIINVKSQEWLAFELNKMMSQQNYFIWRLEFSSLNEHKNSIYGLDYKNIKKNMTTDKKARDQKANITSLSMVYNQ